MLNWDGRAEVLCEISPEAYDEALRSAQIFVMPLKDSGVSAGHVRLMTATDVGIPVVATRARSLVGYVEDGVTALLVPANDPGALGEAVDRLLANPEERRRLIAAALERARQWTYADYFSAIASLVRDPLRPERRTNIG